MMKVNEKRRAIANALEQLRREGSAILNIANHTVSAPVITVDVPPTWLLKGSVPIRECVKGIQRDMSVNRLNGCLVYWASDELPEVYQITQNLNPYAPEMIAHWPVNL
ncbi:hypothetical protein V9G51_002001 [Vibrio cholerae]